MTDPLESLGLDHVEFYVRDCEAAAENLATVYGFDVVGRSPADRRSHRGVAVRQHGVVLLLTEGLDGGHPATAFVQAHGDGVGDIAFRTQDVRGVFRAAVARGASPLREPTDSDGLETAAVQGFGDVRHSLVQRDGPPDEAELPPGVKPVQAAPGAAQTGLLRVDHIAVLVQADELKRTVQFYDAVFGFRMIFEERFVVGSQGMNSQVVQNRGGDVTFTVIEPDTHLDPGQIDDFVRNHGGAGVQHLAFLTEDIVRSVAAARGNGAEFLVTPGVYYDRLPDRMNVAHHSVPELRALSILADADHAGQLFQIFSRSSHPRNTYFVEIIERLGAETFGRGNVRALYEAIEFERANPAPGS